MSTSITLKNPIEREATKYLVTLANAKIEVSQEEFYFAISHFAPRPKELARAYKLAEKPYPAIELVLVGVDLEKYKGEMYKGGRWTKDGQAASNQIHPLAPRRAWLGLDLAKEENCHEDQNPSRATLSQHLRSRGAPED